MLRHSLEEGTQSAWLYELLKPHVAEIAVSILAEVIAVRNGVGLAQKKAGSLLPATSAPSS